MRSRCLVSVFLGTNICFFICPEILPVLLLIEETNPAFYLKEIMRCSFLNLFTYLRNYFTETGIVRLNFSDVATSFRGNMCLYNTSVVFVCADCTWGGPCFYVAGCLCIYGSCRLIIEINIHLLIN